MKPKLMEVTTERRGNSSPRSRPPLRAEKKEPVRITVREDGKLKKSMESLFACGIVDDASGPLIVGRTSVTSHVRRQDEVKSIPNTQT